jgi:hypothetical protein
MATGPARFAFGERRCAPQTRLTFAIAKGLRGICGR